MTNRHPESVPSIFVHFFNDQMHHNYDLHSRYSVEHLSELTVMPAKIAYLLTDGDLIVPTIDLAESPALFHVLPSLRPVLDEGSLIFCGQAVDPLSFLRHKRQHFSSVNLYPQYFTGTLDSYLDETRANWVRRIRSTTRDITARWRFEIDRIDDAGMRPQPGLPLQHLLIEAYSHLDDSHSALGFLESLHDVPEKLDGDAFLWEIIGRRKLVSFSTNHGAAYSIRLLLAQQWLLSHLDEYEARILVDLPGLGKLDCDLKRARSRSVISYRAAVQVLAGFGILGPLKSATFDDLVLLKSLTSFAFFKRAIWWPRTVGHDIEIIDGAPPAPSEQYIFTGSRDMLQVGHGSPAFDHIKGIVEKIYLDCMSVRTSSSRVVNLSISHVEALTLKTGDITGSERVINMTSGESSDIKPMKVSIKTGNIVASLAAINVNSKVEHLRLIVDRIDDSLGNYRDLLNDVLTLLSQVNVEESGITDQEKIDAYGALEILSTSIAQPKNEHTIGRIHNALDRLGRVVQKAGPAAAGLASLIESIRQIVVG